MDDLIERLRKRVTVFNYDSGCKPSKRLRNPDGPEAADELTALRERVAAADKALYDGLVKASGARGLRISRLTDAIEAARAHLLTPESDNG